LITIEKAIKIGKNDGTISCIKGAVTHEGQEIKR
jgi:hypothetical protein